MLMKITYKKTGIHNTRFFLVRVTGLEPAWSRLH